mgnify:CR=1 FL=1
MGELVAMKVQCFHEREVKLLKKLAEFYHTLPVSLEELTSILNGAFQSREVYDLLVKVVKAKALDSVYFAGRNLVYLNLKKIRRLTSKNHSSSKEIEEEENLDEAESA